MASADNPSLAAVLDVDNVLALGLAFHLSQDEPSRSTRDGRLSAAMLSDFGKMEGATPTDAAYLFGIKSVIVMLGDGLTDLVCRQRADLAAADEWRRTESTRIRDNHQQEFYANLISRALMYGGLGFALFATVAPDVQSHLVHHDTAQTFSVNLGFVGAVVFAAGSRVFHSKIANARDERVSKRHDWMRGQAQRRYFKGRHELLKISRDRASDLWKAYTGKSAPELVSLLAIAAEEMRAHEGEMRARKKATESLLHSVFDKLSAWRRERDKRHNQAAHEGKAHA